VNDDDDPGDADRREHEHRGGAPAAHPPPDGEDGTSGDDREGAHEQGDADGAARGGEVTERVHGDVGAWTATRWRRC
jgi:hypothetical protein